MFPHIGAGRRSGGEKLSNNSFGVGPKTPATSSGTASYASEPALSEMTITPPSGLIEGAIAESCDPAISHDADVSLSRECRSEHAWPKMAETRSPALGPIELEETLLVVDACAPIPGADSVEVCESNISVSLSLCDVAFAEIKPPLSLSSRRPRS